MGRNSDEAVLEDRDNCGRWDFSACDFRDSRVESRSQVGCVKDIGRVLSGDNGAGGLLGGIVIGLSGIWKYLVVFGRSIVAMEATDFVCVGA